MQAPLFSPKEWRATQLGEAWVGLAWAALGWAGMAWHRWVCLAFGLAGIGLASPGRWAWREGNDFGGAGRTVHDR
jgi:hypothetical protein